MDWLRSEDLKEEKVVTTPVVTITRQKRDALVLVTSTCGRLLTLWARETKKFPAKNDLPKSSRKMAKPRGSSVHERRTLRGMECLVVEDDVEK